MSGVRWRVQRMCGTTTVGTKLACQRCGMTVHAECVLWACEACWACWACEACLAADVDGDEDQPWNLSRAAGLLALARADGTVITYAALLRRFVALVQRSARRKGNTLSFADILPPGDCAEVSEGAVLASAKPWRSMPPPQWRAHWRPGRAGKR